MEEWQKILAGFGPREEGSKDFYPEALELEQPVLLPKMEPVAAAFVAARVLRAVAGRRGTQVSPSALQALEKALRRGLSDEARHHCEAEAEEVLRWLEARGGPETDEIGPSPTPELDLMVAADLKSRLSVALFAMEAGYDLELEYFDEATHTWHRTRAMLKGIDGEEIADFRTALKLKDRDGEFRVPLKFVRWLMPVSSTVLTAEASARIIPFRRDE